MQGWQYWMSTGIMLQLRWHLLLFGTERFWTSKSMGFKGVVGGDLEKRPILNRSKSLTTKARGGPWQTVYSCLHNHRAALSPLQCRAWPPVSDAVCSPTSPPAINKKSMKYRTYSKQICGFTLVTQFGFFRLWLSSLPYLPLSPVASMLQIKCEYFKFKFLPRHSPVFGSLVFEPVHVAPLACVLKVLCFPEKSNYKSSDNIKLWSLKNPA